jgi:hypothetical protein
VVSRTLDNSLPQRLRVLRAAALAIAFCLCCALAARGDTALRAYQMHRWSWRPAAQLHWLTRLERLEVHLDFGYERQWRNWSMRLSVAAPERPARAAECECI